LRRSRLGRRDGRHVGGDVEAIGKHEQTAEPPRVRGEPFPGLATRPPGRTFTVSIFEIFVGATSWTEAPRRQDAAASGAGPIANVNGSVNIAQRAT